MVKLLGAAMVVGGLTGVGALRAAALDGRLRELEELRAALMCLRSLVNHTRLPAAQAFRSAAGACRGIVGESLADAAWRLENRSALPAGEVWFAAYEGRRSGSCLAEADLEVLRDFCRQFGRLDIDSQMAVFDDTLQRLDLARARALEERDRFGRLFRFSGLAAGLSLVILLL